MTELSCPNCGRTWEDDYVCEDVVVELEEQLKAKEAAMAEMREFLRGFVDEFDKTPSVYSVTRVLTKADIQTMRRLVEKS